MNIPGVSALRDQVRIDREDLFNDFRKDERRPRNLDHLCDHPGPSPAGGYIIAGHGPVRSGFGFPKVLPRDENLKSKLACQKAIDEHRLVIGRVQHAPASALCAAGVVRLSRMMFVPSATPTNIPGNLPHDIGKRWEDWHSVRSSMGYDDRDIDQDQRIDDYTFLDRTMPIAPHPVQAVDECLFLAPNVPSVHQVVKRTITLHQEMAQIAAALDDSLVSAVYVCPSRPTELSLVGITDTMSSRLMPRRHWAIPRSNDRDDLLMAEREPVGHNLEPLVGALLPPIGHRFGCHPVVDYACGVADRLTKAAAKCFPSFELHPFPTPMTEAFHALRHSSIIVAVSRSHLLDSKITRVPGYISGSGSCLMPCFFNVARSGGTEGLLLEVDQCPVCGAGPAGYPFENSTCHCGWRKAVEGFRTRSTARMMGMMYVSVSSMLDVYAPVSLDEPILPQGKLHLNIFGDEAETMRWTAQRFAYNPVGDTVFGRLLGWSAMTLSCVVWTGENQWLAQSIVDGPMLWVLFDLLKLDVLHADISVVCSHGTYYTVARIGELPAFGYAMGYGDRTSATIAMAAAWAMFLSTQDHAVDAVWRILFIYGGQIVWDEFRAFLQGMGHPLPTIGVASLRDLSARAVTDKVARLLIDLDLPFVQVGELPSWDY